MEKAKFTYSRLDKVFAKQTKLIEEQGKKQIYVIPNQNKVLEALTNKDDHKIIYIKYLIMQLKKDLMK